MGAANGRNWRVNGAGVQRLGSERIGLGGVLVVIQLDLQLPLGLFGHQVGADERVNVAIHDAVHVSGAELGAMVFDHAVGLHDVGTDLAAKGNVQLGLVELVRMRLALLYLEIVKPGTQHFHGHFAVFALAALGLAADDDVGRQVRDADGGFHFVDVLAAFATGAESVDTQIFGTDVDFDLVVDFRNHEDRRKGRVPAGGLIERRDANESMNAGFAREQPVGVFTDELDRCGLDAGLFAGSFVEKSGVNAFTFRPAQ